MRPTLIAIASCMATVPAFAAPACGLKGASIPVGTPMQELTITDRDRPTMGFGGTPVTRVSVVARPCHGTLSVLHPPGFRYAPAPGFAGRDMYAIQGCTADGRCGVTGAIVTVTP